MGFLLSCLEATGPDPKILQLDRLLGGPFLGGLQTIRSMDQTDYQAMLSILAASNQSDWDALQETLEWLLERSDVLRQLDARIVLEIQCILPQPSCAEFLLFPQELIAALSDLECDLRIQYIKELE